MNSKNANSEWWADFFTGLAAKTLGSIYPQEQTIQEADFIESVLPSKNKLRILDAPCGTGRLSLELAKRGHSLVGVDICKEAIAEAQANAQEANLPIEFSLGDMRDLPNDSSFDAIFCMGNSFAYFDDEGNKAFLTACYQTLKPGGMLILDAPLVAESIYSSFPPNSWGRIAGMLMLRNAVVKHEESRLETEYTFIQDDITEVKSASYRVHSFRELKNLILNAGFNSVEDRIELSEKPYTAGAMGLIWLATR